MTIASTEPRRFVVRAAGARHDVVAAGGHPLGQVLAVIGVPFGAEDRLLDPEGTVIDLATPAGDLSEGGVYSVAQPDTRPLGRRRRAARSEAERGPALSWTLTGASAVTLILVLASGSDLLRVLAAVALGVLGVASAVAWALRAGRAVPVSSMFAPLATGAASAALAVPRGTPDAAALTVSAAAFGAAVLAGIAGVLVVERGARAAAWAVSAVLVGIGGLAMLCPLAGWSLPQFALVLSAASLVAIRALPTVALSVDDGYHVDFGRFMVLRWTVRGRVPEYLPEVDAVRASGIVREAEGRMGAVLPLLSLVAVPGIPAYLDVLASGSVLERVCGWAGFIATVLGLVLVSRRTTAARLRKSPRIAAVAGLAWCAVLAPFVVSSPALFGPLAGGLLVAGVVAAVAVIPVAAGGRSLSWSRTGDIVESIAIAMVVPAALVAAGTVDTLRGVLVG